MKFLDKLSLKIFSIIMFVVSITLILIVLNVIPLKYITDSVAILTSGTNNIKITIVVAAVLLLLAIKGLFFTSKPVDTGKDGIVLENTSGKLVISKESLENMIASVVKEIPGAESISSRTILDKDKNLIVYVTTVVSRDVMLKDISTELQTRIKNAMKRTADLEVKEVNIRIKNITSKKVKGLPEPVENEETISNTNEEKSEENEETEN